MDNQRLFLYTALGLISFLIYLTWMQTYHPPEPPAIVETIGADGQGVVAGAPAAPSAVDNVGDLPSAAGSSTTSAVSAEVAKGEKFVSVKTDVLDIQLSSIGGTLTNVNLLDYSVSLEDQETPFALVNNEPLDLLVAESGLQSGQGLAAPTHKEPYGRCAGQL